MISINGLETKLKNNELDSIYLLYGEEIYLLEATFKKIKKAFGELVLGINYINIDDTNINNLVSEVKTPAFGYPKKLIIVKNVGLFKKEGRKKNTELENLKDNISEYISDNIDIIKQTVILVIIEEQIDTSKLYKTLEQYGIICNFEKQKLPDLIKRMKVICKAYDVNLDDEVARYFIEICGTTMQELINEIRKLIEYTGKNGTITKELIDKLAIKQMDNVIFDLTDSLGKKDIKTAIDVLNELLYKKEPIQRILITLYNHLKKLYILKLSEKYNKELSISLSLKPNQIFLINKYKTQAKYFKEGELRKILDELINLDANYKIGLIDINIGLEAILCTYCS